MRLSERRSIRWKMAPMLLAAFGVFVAARPAQADSIQISLNNLTFGIGSSSEVFNGSFSFDTTADLVTSVNILAAGATDVFGSGPLPFDGVEFTNMPSQFGFDDGLNDFLFLNLPSGLSVSSYDFTNASLFGDIFGSSAAPISGSFSVNGATTAVPEPNSLLLVCVGLIFLCISRIVRGRPAD